MIILNLVMILKIIQSINYTMTVENSKIKISIIKVAKLQNYSIKKLHLLKIDKDKL